MEWLNQRIIQLSFGPLIKILANSVTNKKNTTYICIAIVKSDSWTLRQDWATEAHKIKKYPKPVLFFLVDYKITDKFPTVIVNQGRIYMLYYSNQ
jgi:hypothetical protein